MFRASPMLRRLVIQDDIATLLRHVNQPSSKPTIELPNLKHLEVQVHRVRDERADVAGLIGIFDFPSLETLIIRNIWQEEWSAITYRYQLPEDPLDFTSPSSSNVWRRNRRSLMHPHAKSFPFLTSLNVVFATSPKKVGAASRRHIRLEADIVLFPSFIVSLGAQ
ncbi:hypothetical protein JR316_0006468 [Psilocybe cubensis]|uniref:Uncharacterized protein n=1 Tax=Psilocybe cubensis TaxID=181762 RepID=A0ACB8H1R4_PSICU|nr:hypothetical protein JR316_0006468 [Psilocybe cubensis]KAH9481938.1 hypothetical protein JR316_0006468 [Psilocybe cubensis]